MASKCISKLDRSQSPSSYPNSLNHGLQVHLWVHSIYVSKCLSNTLDQVHLQGATAVVRRYRANRGGQSDGEYIFGRPRSRLTSSHFHLLLSYNENSHSIFPNFWSHSLCPRFCGSAQLHGSPWQGGIISSHLPTLLEFNVEGTRAEIFAVSPIAIPMQTCTQWTHSDVWSQLATTLDCLFKIGDRQREKKQRNSDRRAIWNATRGIESGRGVMIWHQGVSNSSDGARPLWRSHSARTEMFFADEDSAHTTAKAKQHSNPTPTTTNGWASYPTTASSMLCILVCWRCVPVLCGVALRSYCKNFHKWEWKKKVTAGLSWE